MKTDPSPYISISSKKKGLGVGIWGGGGGGGGGRFTYKAHHINDVKTDTAFANSNLFFQSCNDNKYVLKLCRIRESYQTRDVIKRRKALRNFNLDNYRSLMRDRHVRRSVRKKFSFGQRLSWDGVLLPSVLGF